MLTVSISLIVSELFNQTVTAVNACRGHMSTAKTSAGVTSPPPTWKKTSTSKCFRFFFSALVLYRYFPGMFLSHPLQFFSPYSLLLCPSLKLCSILISSQFSSASESQCCTLCLLFCGTYSGTQGLSPCLYQAPLCFSAFDLQLLSTLQCFSWDLFGLSTFVKATTKKH